MLRTALHEAVTSQQQHPGEHALTAALDEAAAPASELARLFREMVRTDVAERLAEDPDFDPGRFPTAARAFPSHSSN